jgi:hypothetical protein
MCFQRFVAWRVALWRNCDTLFRWRPGIPLLDVDALAAQPSYRSMGDAVSSAQPEAMSRARLCQIDPGIVCHDRGPRQVEAKTDELVEARAREKHAHRAPLHLPKEPRTLLLLVVGVFGDSDWRHGGSRRLYLSRLAVIEAFVADRRFAGGVPPSARRSERRRP